RFTAGVSDQMSGLLIGKIVFVNHRLGRGATNRGSARIDKPFEAAPAHGLGDRERAAHVGSADGPAVAEGGAGREVEDVFDAVKMWRIMPFVGKKIATQYRNVLGKRVGRLKAARCESRQRAPNALLGG